jgi:hypothetical protein
MGPAVAWPSIGSSPCLGPAGCTGKRCAGWRLGCWRSFRDLLPGAGRLGKATGAWFKGSRARHVGPSLATAQACTQVNWGSFSVVTTGPRRVVTTLSVGAAGCGTAPPGVQQGLMSTLARASLPCWGRKHTLASRLGWGRTRRQSRPRTRISRPCGRRVAGDQAGWGTRRSGQGDA